MANWAPALLQAIGAPVTPQNLQLMNSWQRWEGGATNNDASYNWLNTTVDGPGAVRDINSVGVTAFDTFQHGISALARTLQNGRYSDLLAGFRSGNPYTADVRRGLSTWLSGSPDSEAGARYASKVLGVRTKADLRPKDLAQKVIQMEPTGGPSRSALLSYVMASNSSLISGEKPPPIMDYFRQIGPQMSDQIPTQKGKPGSNPNVVYEAPGTDYGNALVGEAKQYLGIPYVWGGANPKTGFDCSGLVKYLYAKHGVNLPHLAAAQAKMGIEVPLNQLAPGDLVFFNGLKHMGIYIGNNQMLHAPKTGDVVKISDLSGYLPKFVTARRIPMGGQSA